MEYSGKSIHGIVEVLKQQNLLKRTHNIQEDFFVNNLTYFSGDAAAGNLFICKGAGFREEYLNEAIGNGISCYMSEKEFETNTSAIIVNDIRKAMSVVAAYFYENPQKDIKLTGVTGTKGKTTTVFYIKKILDLYTKVETALLSTVEINTGDGHKIAHLTTPESLDLQRLLRKVRDNGIDYLTMEVSSQAYKHNRVFGVYYDIGIFMNIDEDHIGPTEHEDYEDYLNCKLQLMKNCKTAIILSDTRDFGRVKRAADEHAEKVIVIGGEGGDYHVESISKEKVGFSFELVSASGYKERYSIDLEGRFNVKNAVCAIVAAKEYGVPYEVIREAVKNISIPGRMNVFNDERITVIVDFAHNKLSFGELFKSLRLDYPDTTLTVVCGSIGSRTQMRRKEIGTLCGQYADKIYLTADNPGFEDPKDICNDIAQYIERYKKPYVIIEDRTDAIENAISQAKKGDIIIVTGKGEEDYQMIKGKYEYYESDISVVKRMMGA